MYIGETRLVNYVVPMTREEWVKQQNENMKSTNKWSKKDERVRHYSEQNGYLLNGWNGWKDWVSEFSFPYHFYNVDDGMPFSYALELMRGYQGTQFKVKRKGWNYENMYMTFDSKENRYILWIDGERDDMNFIGMENIVATDWIVVDSVK